MGENGSRAAGALSAEEMSERLAAFVAEQSGIPASAARVRQLRRLAGGASRELWSLDLDLEGERLDLVLRRDPPGRSAESDRGLEFRVLRAASEAGVPVPRVHWCATDSERLDGGAVPGRERTPVQPH